jgi:hypothetical protein
LKLIRKRLTYANVMSSIAVFLVLGGATAVAAKKIGSNEIKGNSITTGKIKKNAITTSKIKKSAITTAKIKNGAVTGPKVNVGTLGTVPSATRAITAENFEKYVPFGIITANNGEAKQLVSYGPFSLIGECKEEGGSLGAYVIFATTENNTSFGGDDENGGSIGPGTPASERTIEDPGASSSGAPENSDGYDDQFNAQAPSGRSWAGTVESWASKEANQCRWSGYILKTS